MVFDHVSGGLESSNESALAELEIAGADGKWVAADAVVYLTDIVTVIVSSPLVSSPVSARYAYSTNPAANNLVNSGGSPASPIREVTPDTTLGFCGDAYCGPGEDRCNCLEDCGWPYDSEQSCDDGLDNDCDSDFDCDDADCTADPACFYCGDMSCNSDENQCSCSTDCGAPPDNETQCSNDFDDDCDSYTDCNDSDCFGTPSCPQFCGDGVCEEGEDCNSCPADCDSVTKGKPSGRFCCGNGIPEDPESDGRCDGNP